MQSPSPVIIPTALRPLQSIAALLPPEIVDCIFSHSHSHSDYTHHYGGSVFRDKHLNDLSVVAEGWKSPARRWLFRNVKIQSWEHLSKSIPEWAGHWVAELELDFSSGSWPDPQRVATAVFDLLKKLSNVRYLELCASPFSSFNATDPTTTQATPLLLPRLSELNISFGSPSFPHSVCFDLLKASGHRSECYTSYGHRGHAVEPTADRLDFGGDLRCLVVDAETYRTATAAPASRSR